MKTRFLILLTAVAFILTGCAEKKSLSFDEEQQIIKEVDKHFDYMLSLAQQEDFILFNSFIDEEASMLVEGVYLADDDVNSYLAELLGTIADTVSYETKRNYQVGNSDYVYLDLVCFRPPPTDTSHGIDISPPPINLYYLNNIDRGKKSSLINKKGSAVYVLPDSETSMLARPDTCLFPIKMLGASFTIINVNDKWKLSRTHLSLGLKFSETYKLKKKLFK